MNANLTKGAIVTMSGVAAFHGLLTGGMFLVLFVLPETSLLNAFRGPIHILEIGNPGFLALQLAVGSIMSISWLVATYLRHQVTRSVAALVLSLQALVTIFELINGSSAEGSLYRYDWVSIFGGVLLIVYAMALRFWPAFQSA